MKTIIKLAFVLLIVGVMVMVPARANLLVNGGFETGPDPGSVTVLASGDTSITGWTVIGDSIDYVGTYWQPAEGARSIDLNGNNNGGVEQSFATTPGQAYKVTFELAGNPDGAPSDKTLVTTTGLVQNSFDFDISVAGSTKINMGWKLESFIFTADSATTLLTFLSTTLDSSFGPAIDKVDVEVVPADPSPEPSSVALIAGGILGLCFVACSRRSRKAA